MKTMTTALEIISHMEAMRNEQQCEVLMRFFKTAPGEYGHGDEFLGIKVPQTREVVKIVDETIDFSEIHDLLMSQWHEVRLCGFLILVSKFEKSAKRKLVNDEKAIKNRDETVDFYLKHGQQANNWDLVDLSSPKILGHWLLLPTGLGDKMKIMDKLAESDNLWLQRIGMVATWTTSKEGEPSWCLRYAEKHLHHKHDLMHKAVGWMLREMGKRVSMNLLRAFLQEHANEMPRTMLRYAIEQMGEEEKKMYMKKS